MNWKSRPENLSGKQVCVFAVSFHLRDYLHMKNQALAAIGQGRLIALWDNLFGQLEQPIAQVLLTKGDISDVWLFLFFSICPFPFIKALFT